MIVVLPLSVCLSFSFKRHTANIQQQTFMTSMSREQKKAGGEMISPPAFQINIQLLEFSRHNNSEQHG